MGGSYQACCKQLGVLVATVSIHAAPVPGSQQSTPSLSAKSSVQTILFFGFILETIGNVAAAVTIWGASKGQV